MNQGYSKVSLQSSVPKLNPDDERMQADQPSVKNQDVHIPEGIFNTNYNKPTADGGQQAFDEEYPKLKTKPDEFDWKLVQVTRNKY